MSKNQESMKIWYLKLTQDSRYTFLDQFKAAKPQIDKQRKSEYEISLHTGKMITSTPVGAAAAKPIELGINIAGDDVFQDNVSTPTTKMLDLIDKFILDVTAATQNLEGTDAKIKVTSLEVAASASRFRNTNDAANMTWAELSKARAVAVKDELVRKLTAIKIDVPTDIIKIRGGYHPDGTTGPNPGLIPNKDNKMVQVTISNDGTFNNIMLEPTASKINVYGPPLKTKQAYDQYKFLVMLCKLEITYDEPPIVQPVQSQGYTMEIKMKKQVGTFRFPTRSWPDHSKMPSVRKGVSAKGILQACELF